MSEYSSPKAMGDRKEREWKKASNRIDVDKRSWKTRKAMYLLLVLIWRKIQRMLSCIAGRCYKKVWRPRGAGSPLRFLKTAP